MTNFPRPQCMTGSHGPRWTTLPISSPHISLSRSCSANGDRAADGPPGPARLPAALEDKKQTKSMMLRVLTFASRFVFAVFLLLTTIYCVLAYVPFTYQQIIVAAPMAWLIAFAKFHQWIYWLALAIAAP